MRTRRHTHVHQELLHIDAGTHTCTHTHTHMYTHTHAHMYTHTHARTHIYTHTHVHTHTHKCTHTRTHVHIHTRMYTHTQMYTSTHTSKHLSFLCLSEFPSQVRGRHTRTRTYTHTQASISPLSLWVPLPGVGHTKGNFIYGHMTPTHLTFLISHFLQSSSSPLPAPSPVPQCNHMQSYENGHAHHVTGRAAYAMGDAAESAVDKSICTIKSRIGGFRSLAKDLFEWAGR